jgi:glycosyltransferase involved in cell wall biosynthesis
MNDTKLSVVVPIYNEEENLSRLHKELTSVLKKIESDTEIVYVNDGSTDKSAEVLKSAIAKETSKTRVKLIEFRKNFGQTAAIVAGIDNSEGNLISFLDADLQNDPGSIPKFLEKMKEGYDAVFGWRKERKDTSLRSFLSRMANKIINLVFAYPFHDVGCSARVVKKEFLINVDLYGELHRILPVLIYLNGAKIGEIVVEHHARRGGKSKYGFNRIIKTIIDIITVKFISSYGTKPAYVFGSFGLASFVVSGVIFLLVAYKKLFLGVFVHNDPLFLIAMVLVLLGVQFFLMGFLAELQVRTYFESQGKSIYEIKEIERF